MSKCIFSFNQEHESINLFNPDSDLSLSQSYPLLLNYSSPPSVLISPSVIPIIHVLISNLFSKIHPFHSRFVSYFIFVLWTLMYFLHLVFQFTDSYFSSDHVPLWFFHWVIQLRYVCLSIWNSFLFCIWPSLSALNFFQNLVYSIN